MTCCDECGDGCNGGYLMAAWQWWVSTGIVTGGNYTTKTGCLPYPLPPCEHHENGTHYPPCQHNVYPTPGCTHTCQAGYSTPYKQDKHFGKSAYAVDSDVSSIQQEIYTNGPVEAAFDVYADFLIYRSGVYQHKRGSLDGGHAVKILGWGTESGTPYWLVANSWNSDWGENGYFKIIRGRDECGIESGIVAGMAK